MSRFLSPTEPKEDVQTALETSRNRRAVAVLRTRGRGPRFWSKMARDSTFSHGYMVDRISKWAFAVFGVCCKCWNTVVHCRGLRIDDCHFNLHFFGVRKRCSVALQSVKENPLFLNESNLFMVHVCSNSQIKYARPFDIVTLKFQRPNLLRYKFTTMRIFLKLCP